MENKNTPSKGLKNQEIILKELLAKSLVLFIGVGLISGLAFGVYLLDVKNTSQLVFVEGPSISVVTEKIDFKKGEEIKIRIVNSGTVPVYFDKSYDLQVTGLSGILMYSHIVMVDMGPFLLPGAEVELSWDQIRNDGTAVLEGLYKISAKGIDDQGKEVSRSTTITIWK